MMGESEFMEQSNEKKRKIQLIVKILLAAAALGASAFLLKGDVMDLLDLVASCCCDGLCCYACDWQAVLAL